MWHKVNFKRSLTGLDSVFSFSWTSCFTKALEHSLSYYLPRAGGKIIGFIPFPRVLVLWEIQSVSSRIWTRVAVSITITITPRAPRLLCNRSFLFCHHITYICYFNASCLLLFWHNSYEVILLINWTPVSRTIGEHSTHWANGNGIWKWKVILVVFGALGTATKELVHGLEDLEIREREETIQTKTLLRSTRILRRVQETWGDGCHLDSCGKPSIAAGVKNS